MPGNGPSGSFRRSRESFVVHHLERALMVK